MKHSNLRKLGMTMLVYLPLCIVLLFTYAIGAIGGIILQGFKLGATLGTDWVDRMMDAWDDYKL